MSYCGSTPNLGNHLRLIHKITATETKEKEKNEKKDKKEQENDTEKKEAISSSKPARTKKQTTMDCYHFAFGKSKQESSNKAMISFIIHSHQPFSLVENYYFQKFMKELNENF